jgi:2-oxoglutarate/2-oxoacid ferredoxin oxidoreductase subunit alpha
MRSLLINELEIDPVRLARVLHYDGTPITARFIANAIRQHVNPTPLQAAGKPRRKETV